MKKLLVGLTLLSSLSSFAGINTIGDCDEVNRNLAMSLFSDVLTADHTRNLSASEYEVLSLARRGLSSQVVESQDCDIIADKVRSLRDILEAFKNN